MIGDAVVVEVPNVVPVLDVVDNVVRMALVVTSDVGYVKIEIVH